MGRGGSAGGGGLASGTRGAPGRPKQTQSASGVTYVRSAAATRNGEVLVSVSVSKLDKAWKQSGSGYIDSGGSNSIGDRRQATRELVQSGKTIDAPQVVVEKNGVVRIRDGRHRTAAVRDAGKDTIVVSVSRTDAERLRNLD